MISINRTPRYLKNIFCIAALALPLVASATMQEHTSTTEPIGIGDSIFPTEGDRGIDVTHYHLSIKWDDKTGRIDAEAILEINATHKLDTFSLDFHGLKISKVAINHKACSYSRAGDKLNIVLQKQVKKYQTFTLSVAYSGKPEAVPDSPTVGWESTNDGATTLSEPISSKNWFPSNNHPKDKATYTFDITVPSDYDAIANGIPSEPIVKNGEKHFNYEMKEPMASYLALIAIGHYTLEKLVTKSGIPLYNYYYKGMSESNKKPFARELEIMAFFSEKFGPYPFSSGGIVASSGGSILAFETQTRSFFGTPTSEKMVAHEIAHQWFGNQVSLSDWRETWLKEGFATYASALWFEHLNGKASMDEWVKGSFESLMGIQHIPKTNLKQLLKIFEIKEKLISKSDIENLIKLGTQGETNPKELKDALALVPERGIGTFKLDPILTKVNFDHFRLTFPQYTKFMDIFEEHSLPMQRTAKEIIENLAEAPQNVKSISQIYSSGVYTRGSLAVHALRIKLGDQKFFEILKSYLAQYKNTHASSKEFREIAAKISNENLEGFFKQWLEDKIMPDMPEYGLYKKDYM